MGDERRSAPITVEPVGDGGCVVASGDTMVSIAEATGHFWERIWNDPANAALKAARREPNVLLPGDRVTVQPLREKLVPCQTTRVHTFRRRGVPTKVTFHLKTSDGKGLPGRRYQLDVGAQRFEGETDGEGKLEHHVATTARTGELTVWLAVRGLPKTASWTLGVGDLGPIETLRGVQGRLRALGHPAGADGVLDERTRDGLRALQTASALPVTGDLDDATVGALRQAYGF